MVQITGYNVLPPSLIKWMARCLLAGSCLSLAFWLPRFWGMFDFWVHSGLEPTVKAQAISSAVQAITALAMVILTTFYAHITRAALSAARAQATIANQQFELGQQQFHLARDQFIASMTPHITLKVYPKNTNTREIHWEMMNVGESDLFVQNAEVRAAFPKGTWVHLLNQYMGGVLVSKELLKSMDCNSAIIPNEYFLSSESPSFDEVLRLLTISVTVSDVAQLLSFKFEFSPGKGQTVKVMGNAPRTFN